MAATRNRNTQLNYKTFIKEQTKYSEYDMYANSSSGSPYDIKQSGNGLNPGKLPRNALSYNPVSIESSLFGINSTNLVNPETPVVPEFKYLKTNDLYKKDPVYIPTPLNVSKTQRPSQWNS